MHVDAGVGTLSDAGSTPAASTIFSFLYLVTAKRVGPDAPLGAGVCFDTILKSGCINADGVADLFGDFGEAVLS